MAGMDLPQYLGKKEEEAQEIPLISEEKEKEETQE